MCVFIGVGEFILRVDTFLPEMTWVDSRYIKCVNDVHQQIAIDANKSFLSTIFLVHLCFTRWFTVTLNVTRSMA